MMPEIETTSETVDRVAHRPHRPRAAFPITIETVISDEHAEEFYALYLAAFGPLRNKAASRQVLHRSEFFDEMSDPRVWKYVAWQGAQPIGLATMTRDLETVPWVSPEYYRERYPEHAKRNAIFYLGFILVHPHRQRAHILERLIQAGVGPLIEARAVCGYDICTFNEQSFGLASRIEQLLHSLADVEVKRIDTQSYYQVSFR